MLMFLNRHGLTRQSSMTFLFSIQGTGNHKFYFPLFGAVALLFICLMHDNNISLLNKVTWNDGKMIVLGKPLDKSKDAVSESTYIDLHLFIMD